MRATARALAETTLFYISYDDHMAETIMTIMKTNRGFTLLELLLVVFILSTIAAMTVSFVNNADQQFRYEETQRRLLSIRRATIGDLDAVYYGERLLSGFVVENGALPATISALTAPPAGFEPYGLKDPIFDPDPDPDGFNNGGAVMTLGNVAEKLVKGHRGGYLSMQPGDSEYRDGWGNWINDGNFGWTVAAIANSLTITSLGADGQSGGSDYNADISNAVAQSDWSIDISGWRVTVTNNSGGDIPNLRVSLLVYENRSPSPRWRRLTSARVLSLANGASADFTFPGPEAGLSSISTLIPMGQHLLVLVQDANGTPHDSDDMAYLIGGNRVTRHVNWFPRVVMPPAEMLIK